ncbi:MAG: hypothetical protein EAZ61_13110 [Oscillatoriales cyanobacterium]|nr:MAG: hypothetical protein EAZ61_13110 [Oscillatoriales cyanobacterium]
MSSRSCERGEFVKWLTYFNNFAGSRVIHSKLTICDGTFAVEFRSGSDSLMSLRSKLVEFRENGARLGCLIDPLGRSVEVLENPSVVSGEDVLVGFRLDLMRIWG